MLRLSRGVVIASTVLAALVENYISAQYHPYLFWTALAGFVALLVTGDRVRRVALPIVLGAAYLLPGFLIATDPAKQADFNLDIAWVLPLLGLALSDRSLQWSLPKRWLSPLLLWSLVVSVTWPILFLRETDFALWVLPLQRVSNTSFGISPEEMGQRITYFVLLHSGGILVADALYRWFSNQRDALAREVLWPMAIAAGVAASVAFYQGFVDLGFLNQHFWTYMIRASGTLGDPNKLGAVMSFWTVGAVVLARRLRLPWSVVIGVSAIVAGGGAAWLSGSRTGLAAVTISVGIAGVEAVWNWWSNRATTRVNPVRVAMIGGGSLMIAALMVMVLQNASTHTIVARGTLGYLPFVGDRGILTSVNELLWERFGYGPAAVEMIKEHPIEGIGLGMFHPMVRDYGKLVGYTGDRTLVSDNAQSWFRHNLAELGFVGVIPLVWWCVVFAGVMVSRSKAGDRLSVGLLRGILLGFFAASVFGMPAQSIAIVITFWVFAFWIYSERAGPVAPTQTIPSWLTIAAVALVVVHAGMTTVDAFGDLRPLERAKRWDWYYRYGWVFIDKELEPDPGGYPVGRRWTMKKSLSLIPVQGRTLKFVAWIDHPDADKKPVHTRVWADSALVYEGDLTRGAPLNLDIPARPGEKYLVLETEIDRLFRPSDFNPTSRDRRELGLSVRDWTWQ